MIQSVIFASPVCDTREIYYRAAGPVREAKTGLVLSPGAEVSADTYMNLFDAGFWKKYTGCSGWELTLTLSGRARISLFTFTEDGRKEQAVFEKEHEAQETLVIPFTHLEEAGIYAFSVKAESETCLKAAAWQAGRDTAAFSNPVRLALIICTYHRRQALEENLALLKSTDFFKEGHPLQGKLQIIVTDNGSEIPEVTEAGLRIRHNANTGGSGGYTRGMVEARAMQAESHFTHMILMDDDVAFIPESLYRIYALLSGLKPEYQDSVIAGRMFRTDQRYVQYTASDIWNGGAIQHVGWNADMTDPASLPSVNDGSGGEYGGWWMCCFPADFIMHNTPIPFFLHCDDVEYGLRHGGTPIILNGVQAWHETYEYRQTPIIDYYDMRNSLTVNAMYDCILEKQVLHDWWIEKISKAHMAGDLLDEYMLIAGMHDFLQGFEALKALAPDKHHQKMTSAKRGLKYYNKIFWRLTERLLYKNYDAAVKSCKRISAVHGEKNG